MDISLLNSMDTLENKKLSKSTNYFIVIASLLGISPFLHGIGSILTVILLGIVLSIAIRHKISVFDFKIFILVLIVYLLIIIQSIIYQNITWAIVYYPLIGFYFPYVIYRLMGVSYFKYFVNVIFAITIITTPLWFLQSVSPAVDGFMKNAFNWAFPIGWSTAPRSLFFYTAAWSNDVYNATLGIYRNSGAFHEPGAYATFLSLALVANILLSGNYFAKKNKVFIFCILTTLSTAGYITLFIVFGLILWKSKISIPLKFVGLLLFIVLSYSTFTEQDFLKEKIAGQYSNQVIGVQQNIGIYTGASGRFFAFFTSLNSFLNNPITGRGIVEATSEKGTGELHEDTSYNYGPMGVFARFGIFFGVVFMISLFRGFKFLGGIGKQNIFIISGMFVAINLILSTQVFVMHSSIMVIFFIGVYYSEKTRLKPVSG